MMMMIRKVVRLGRTKALSREPLDEELWYPYRRGHGRAAAGKIFGRKEV